MLDAVISPTDPQAAGALPPKRPFNDDPLWYKDAVIYELHVKSFYDANNDGVGDFAGLIDRLDYIAALGGQYHLAAALFFPAPDAMTATTSPITAACIPTTARCTTYDVSSARRMPADCAWSSSWS